MLKIFLKTGINVFNRSADICANKIMINSKL